MGMDEVKFLASSRMTLRSSRDPIPQRGLHVASQGDSATKYAAALFRGVEVPMTRFAHIRGDAPDE